MRRKRSYWPDGGYLLGCVARVALTLAALPDFAEAVATSYESGSERFVG